MFFRRKKDAPTFAYTDVELANTISILGVTFTDDLKWNKHFDNILLSATRRLYVIRTLKPYVSKEKLLEVFLSCIVSLFMYATPLFCDMSTEMCHRIKKFRKRAHRVICSQECKYSIIPDFDNMHKSLSCKFLTKCKSPDHPLHEHVPPKMPCTGHFCLPHFSTFRRQNSFFIWCCMIDNAAEI